MSDERQRFEMLVPFYLNGTLSQQDLRFVQTYLRDHPQAQQSLAFAQHLQQTVRQTTLISMQPTDEQVHRMMRRASKAHPGGASVFRDGWRNLVIAFSGVGLVAIAASLVLSVTPLSLGSLHVDSLNGMPDLELVLSADIGPGHEAIIAHLQKYDGVVISHTAVDGLHRVAVDLKNRAAHQEALIQDLQASGYLEGYTLLASR